MPYFETGLYEYVIEKIALTGSITKREYTRVFHVMVRNEFVGSVAACVAPGIPYRGEPYNLNNGVEYDAQSLCYDISATQDDEDVRKWIVTCQYKADFRQEQPATASIGGNPRGNGQGQPSGQTGQPEEEYPEIEWDFETTMRPFQEDRFGVPLMNTAEDYFTPTPTFEVGNPVLLITRNELDFNVELARSYAYAVNNNPFLGYKSGMVMCMPPKAKRMFKGQYAYWKVSYRLRFYPKFGPEKRWGWQPWVLNAGTREFTSKKETVTTVRAGIVVREDRYVKSDIYLPSSASKVTIPQLLNEFGQVQTERDAEGNLIPIWLKFDIYPVRDFNKLLVRGLS